MPQEVNGLSEDEAWGELEQVFPLTDQGWRDVMTLDPPDRDQAVRDMLALGKLPWVKRTGAGDRAMSLLLFIAAIASPVATIAGGAAGLQSLGALLKGI